jgi:hypothetical protein
VIDRPVATINLIRPEMISAKQLNSRVELLNMQRRAQNAAPLTLEEKKELLRTMITELLIRQAAEKDKIIVTDTEVNAAVQKYKNAAELQLGVTLTEKQFADLVLSQTGLVWEEYVKQLKTQILQQKYITQKKQSLFASVPMPTDAEIEAFYRVNASQFSNPEIIRFSHILSIRGRFRIRTNRRRLSGRKPPTGTCGTAERPSNSSSLSIPMTCPRGITGETSDFSHETTNAPSRSSANPSSTRFSPFPSIR